jgi:hypothetical protein
MRVPSVGRWCVAGVVLSSLAGIAGAAERAEIAGVRRYVAPNGSAHQAVLLKDKAGTGDVAHTHVILFDTSASQVGEHRLHALGVLDAVLQNLPAHDRVRLIAVDVAAESLMREFAAPQSDAMNRALDELKARIPLGATNLLGGVHAAADMLPHDQPGTILYIGDGLSTADILSAADLEPLVAQLRQRRIAVDSYGVGPQMNLNHLGILAQQTGGAVQFDDSHIDPRGDAARNTALQGERLAKALAQPVFRPERIDAPQGVRLMPSQALPLRPDRETVYLVRGDLPANGQISVRGAKTHLEWKLSAATTGPDDAFLAVFTDRAEREGGLANSLAGTSLMNVARAEFKGQVNGLVNFGKFAFQKRDYDRVQQAVDAVRRLDPANRDLAQVEQSTRKLAAKNAALQNENEEDETTAAPPEPMVDEPAADDDLTPRTQPNPNENLLDLQQRAVKIRTQKLRQQVSDVINLIRRLNDPQEGLDQLDRMLTTVRSAIDIEPEVRQQLQKQLVSERLQQFNRQEILDRQRIRIQERQAQMEARLRLADRLELDEERLANLIDRVRALMDEGRHGDDEAFAEAEAVARVSVDLRPNSGVTAAALFNAEAAQQLRRSFRLRARRADQFLETLHQVELSHIPFPDEPPVRFPPAAVWQALTERRRKWANVDLRKDSPNEVRIQTALDEQTEISFIDTSLRDALDYIEDLHNFDILLMEPEIVADGGSVDQTVNLELSGVKLRSALKLMLQPMELDYVIADEVMQVTTATKAGEKMSTRVYPVADLTVPIQSGMGAGMSGGMGMGMMGGMGMGGMGGMGGGMGGMGMGGGMGGMGMGGMGGGMFSIPAEPLSWKKKQ